ncbi:MAG: hypothetical protein L6Q74_05135 [Sphaerotilus natans subsp. sulfidivorans]|uniref:hypothetical protein n=1 Tax=Sphaerotilus sulfidivorans TaxID=639200 RepID=UPI002353D3A5|nr:hypothetical protein [Sphaerotilus sulfidivorans]MCK6401283.1 hypothetical protein [Sphaerotilus sulfidivorans]
MSDFHRAETRRYKQLPGSRNCMQCAVAFVMGLPMADVPDFEQAGPGAWEAFYQFFEARGFTAEMFAPNVQIEGDYIASGQTERGTSHMVVMRGGELLHDPHPSNAGLTAVQVVWLIVRRAGQTGADALRRERGELAARLQPTAEPVLEVRACGCSQAKAGRCVMGDYGALPIGTQLYAGAAPARAEPQPRPTCSSSGLLGASSGVGRECDYWAGGVCTSPEPCQHQQPVKPCRTCGPDGCPDRVACPKGGAA